MTNPAFIEMQLKSFTLKLFVMKKKLINIIIQAFSFKKLYLLCIAVAMLATSASTAQKKQQPIPQNQLCRVTKEEMNELNIQLKQKIAILRATGKLDFNQYRTADDIAAASKTAAGPILFRWPLTTKAYRDFASWHIGNFVDLDPDSFFVDENGDKKDDTNTDPAEIGDYACGDRTYDGHQGIDIGIDPYSWEVQNSGFVQVIAGASGVIAFKHDGEFDENCDWDDITGSTNRGNNIVILHEDGTTASFYMHMKNGSLTSKEEGDFVEAGEYLGTVASSGFSTGPHLHFQVNTGYVDNTGTDQSGTRIDPFTSQTTCTESSQSSWITQLPYTDPAVLLLSTQTGYPDNYNGNCDKTITVNEKNSFIAGQGIYFRSAFRDWVDGSTITHNVYKPDGTLYRTYFSTNPSNYRVYFPPFISVVVSPSDPSGTYRYTASIGGKTYSHYFAINCETNKTLSGSATGHKGTMVSNSITSTQTISSNSSNYIKYMADGKVTLNPGFRATAGCRFVANTLGCNNSAAQPAIPDAPVAANVSEVQQLQDNTALQTRQLLVYPNPGTGLFMVRYSSKEKFTAAIQVRNLAGQVVCSIPAREYTNLLQQQVNITGKPKGMYLVEIITGNNRISGKFYLQ